MKYHCLNGYYFGHREGSIASIASEVPDFFSHLSMLITCLDSTSDIPTLEGWIDYIHNLGIDFEIIGKSIWIPESGVEEIVHDTRTFFGFDELYLLNALPRKDHFIDDIFTPDAYNFSTTIPKKFLEYFLGLGAVRYLSDGIGMNFACESLDLAKRLLSIPIE